MRIDACTLPLLCYLLIASGCGTKSQTTAQQSNTTQQSVSTIQSNVAQQSVTTANNSNVINANQAQNSNIQTATAKGKLDACSLLTSAEIQAVQGETVKEINSSEQSNNNLVMSQCFYTLPTFSKSVSLAVTRTERGKSAPDRIREVWREKFHRNEESEAEREREKERGKGEEEEEGSPARPIPGVGEEAFWAGDNRAGALYVLKKDSILRISVGGPEKMEAKIEKMKSLAEKALKRL